MSVHVPMDPQLPRLESIPRVLELKRTDVTAYDLNPFSFYINYDLEKLSLVDSVVQEFGERFTADQNAEEPKDWVMVQHRDHWHRAQILEKFYNENQECSSSEVCLIDDGRRVLVDVEHIFPIPPEVLVLGPSQSLRIFPQGVEGSAQQIVELFENYRRLKFRVTFNRELDLTSKRKPHTAGVLAEVEVGFEDWIPLRQLFLRNFIEDHLASKGTSRTTHINEVPTNNGGSPSSNEVNNQSATAPEVEIQFDLKGRVKFEPLEPTGPNCETQGHSQADTARNNTIASEAFEQRCNGSSSKTPPESSGTAANGYAGLAARSNSEPARETNGISRSLKKDGTASNGELDMPSSSGEVAKVQQSSQPSPAIICDSDDDSSGSPDGFSGEEAEENIRYTARSGAVPVDVEGEKQGEIMTARSQANANQLAQRNQRRQPKCINYRKTGKCANGDMCPHKHGDDDDDAWAATGVTVEFKDYPDIRLRQDFHGFGLCTHVDEDGRIYLVLPYGAASIWEVLECKPNLEYDFLKITQELSRLYGQQGRRPHSQQYRSEDLAVVWVAEPDSGPLKNVGRGWYRAKILKREDKKWRVLLVDHGAILMVDRENLHQLESDLLLPQQAIRCQLHETRFKKEPGNDLVMYNSLKEKLLVLKVYEYLQEENIYIVNLVEVQDGSKSIHFGELFVNQGIFEWID